MQKNMFWCDLETTGLEEAECTILEVGAIVTTPDFEEVEAYHAVVHQGEEALAKMNDWCKQTHTASGLVTAVQASQLSLRAVEQQLVVFMNKHFPAGKIVMHGNTVGFDWKFINHHMPIAKRQLHYRTVDVSSFKEAFVEKFGYQFDKSRLKDAHRVLPDIRASIAELKDYFQYIRDPRAPVA